MHRAGAPSAAAVPAAPRAADAKPTREEVVAEMRAEAEARAEQGYPDVFEAERTAELAKRPEPRGAPEVESIEAELALIAKRRETTTSEQEIAALEARARELQRLAEAAAATPLRR